MLQITAEFDTFEGAAAQAGKLNAALGGNFVNAMDLMMETDPVERFKMIRDSIKDAGLSFDSMSYYQKRFYTQQLGFKDEAELAAALSGDLDSLGMGVQKTSEDYRKMREDAAALQSVQDQLRNLFLDMVPVFMPLIDALRSFTGWLRQNPKLLKRILVVGALVLALFVAWKVVVIAATLVGMAWNAMKAIGLGLWKLLTFWKKKDTKSTKENTQAIVDNTMSMLKSLAAAAAFALKAIALGAAVWMVGKGLREMAIGFSELFKAAKGMTQAEMSFLNVFFLGLSISLIALVAVFTLFGKVSTNPMVPLGIAVLGAAILATGMALKLMAEGLGFLIDKFTVLFMSVASIQHLDKYTASLNDLGLAMAGLMSSGMSAGAGLVALGLALGLVGLSVSFLGDDLPLLLLFVQAVEGLATAMGTLDSAAGLSKIRSELEEWDSETVAKLAGIAGGMAAINVVRDINATAGGDKGATTERGTSGENPFYVKDISDSQRVKIVMDAAETRRFLEEGTLDTIGKVVRESLEGAQ